MLNELDGFIQVDQPPVAVCRKEKVMLYVRALALSTLLVLVDQTTAFASRTQSAAAFAGRCQHERTRHYHHVMMLQPSSRTATSPPADSIVEAKETTNNKAGRVLATMALCSVLAGNPLQTAAYSNDYLSDTVQSAITSLKEGAGSPEKTLSAFENIAEIITEGKGVGGAINFKGVQLDRGYVADEDTSIYNPGLTLLTESEKSRLVEGIVQSRKAGLQAGNWNSDNEYGFEFIRGSLDPLHMNELSGYLSILPFYGAFLYLVVFGVQQFARGIFPIAYFIGIAAIVTPVLALVAAGPQ